MAEETLFDVPGIQITTARAVLHGDTYVVAQITSVSVVEIAANRMPGWLLMLSSLIAILCCSGTDLSLAIFVVGGCLFLAGVAVVFTAQPKYAVVLGTSGGEQRGLVTPERGLADAVRESIEEAIVKRG